MKKYFVIALALICLLVVAGSCGKKTNPLWGLWTLNSTSPVKTEFMFNDDNTGFIFVADTVRFETSWTQDSLLNLQMFDMNIGKSISIYRKYRVNIDGNTLKLQDVETGITREYSRFVE